MHNIQLSETPWMSLYTRTDECMKNFSISFAVIGGTILGPFIYLISTEWALLFAGLTAGTIAFLFGGKNGE